MLSTILTLANSWPSTLCVTAFRDQRFRNAHNRNVGCYHQPPAQCSFTLVVACSIMACCSYYTAVVSNLGAREKQSSIIFSHSPLFDWQVSFMMQVIALYCSSCLGRAIVNVGSSCAFLDMIKCLLCKSSMKEGKAKQQQKLTIKKDKIQLFLIWKRNVRWKHTIVAGFCFSQSWLERVW